jgi:TetR/AcrR family transcriptional regulator, transcriptional repressor for nem operon
VKPRTTAPAPRDTRTLLLDEAQELAQRLGYGGFSYHDLARRLAITTASIHHHFPAKQDLGRALMARYREGFNRALAEIERRPDAGARLDRFVDLFRKTLASGDRLCLCGMLASEHANLPPAVQKEVRRFFVETEAWLARVLDEGRLSGALAFGGDPADVASALFAALEGAMIAARAFGDHERLTRAAALFLTLVRAAPPARRSSAARPTRLTSARGARAR